MYICIHVYISCVRIYIYIQNIHKRHLDIESIVGNSTQPPLLERITSDAYRAVWANGMHTYAKQCVATWCSVVKSQCVALCCGVL